jgi:hypothetical protein
MGLVGRWLLLGLAAVVVAVTVMLKIQAEVSSCRCRKFLPFQTNAWAEEAYLYTEPRLVLFDFHIRSVVFTTDLPAPELISGCLVRLSSTAWIPYVLALLYESLIFGMTLWKSWTLRAKFGSRTLTSQLLRE